MKLDLTRKAVVGSAITGVFLAVSSLSASQSGMKCVPCATDHVCETFGSECWSRGTGEGGAISCEQGQGACEQLSGQCGAKMAYVPFLGCTLPVGGCGGPHCFDWNLRN